MRIKRGILSQTKTIIKDI
uniref:Uncharacterized protein n=1 Tax=Rhizophora mucronata TaxID=61149 RepID=A0A2P2PAV4_RHIMU